MLSFTRICVCVLVFAAALFPSAAAAQRRCDGGGMLLSYLAGTTDGPPPSAIADIWISGAVPEGMDAAAISALRQAIMSFEGRRPGAAEAAEIAAGDWTGWRARLMSREDFVRGFLEEVGQRRASQGEYAAILQAAQAMRNRLDDMNGAAGPRDRPEDPFWMWRWDATFRQPGATADIAQLQALPDGTGLWRDYLAGRKTAIACALDDMSALPALAAMVQQNRYQRAQIVTALVAGRKVPLDFRTMAYLYGLLEHRLAACTWVGSAEGLASVMRFQTAATQIALSQETLFDVTGIVIDSIEYATSANAGRADAREMDEEFGCTSPLAIALSAGLIRTVQIDASAASDSLFVQSCSTQGLSLAQCACLAELGRGVAPQIEKMGYDRSTTIKWIFERNPMLGIQIGVLCGIGDN